MKKKLFLIPSFLAAGFMPLKVDAFPASGLVEKKEPNTSVFEKLRLQHLYTLAGHRSHSSHRSHRSHSSHRSSSGSGYSFRSYTPPTPAPPPPPSANVYSAPSMAPSFPPASSFPAAPKPVSPSNPAALAPIKTLPGNTDKFKLIVIQVQTAMIAYGYYAGPADGIIGSGSRAALQQMQEAFGLKVTGTVTPEVLNALGITAR